MEAKYEPKTPEQLLGYVVEECGEVCQAIGKTMRWGLDGYNPELIPEQRVLNRDWIKTELNDLKGAIIRLEMSGVLDK